MNQSKQCLAFFNICQKQQLINPANSFHQKQVHPQINYTQKTSLRRMKQKKRIEQLHKKRQINETNLKQKKHQLLVLGEKKMSIASQRKIKAGTERCTPTSPTKSHENRFFVSKKSENISLQVENQVRLDPTKKKVNYFSQANFTDRVIKDPYRSNEEIVRPKKELSQRPEQSLGKTRLEELNCIKTRSISCKTQMEQNNFSMGNLRQKKTERPSKAGKISIILKINHLNKQKPKMFNEQI